MFEVLIFFVFSVVIGLMFLFFGYPFFRFLLPVWGFFVGIAFGVNGMQALLGANVISDLTGLVVGFFLGIILALLAYFLYSVTVYWFGLTVGYILGSGLIMAFGIDSGFLSAVIGIITAVAFVFAFAMMRMPKFLIIILTATSGAMAVIMGLFVLFGKVPEIAATLQLTRYMVNNSFFWVIVWGALAAIGMIFQFAVLQAFNEDLNDSYNWDQKKTKKRKR